MAETNAILRFIHSDAAASLRTEEYLNGDTRPDDGEEVPESEQMVIEALESADTASRIERLNAQQFDAWFEYCEERDLMAIAQALKHFSPQAVYLYFADDEEYNTVWDLTGGKPKRLYQFKGTTTLDLELMDLGWGSAGLDRVIALKQKTSRTGRQK